MIAAGKRRHERRGARHRLRTAARRSAAAGRAGWRRAKPLLVALIALVWRLGHRLLQRLARVARPVFVRVLRVAAIAQRMIVRLLRAARRLAVLLLRLVAALDTRIRRVAVALARAATRAGAIVTPRRATAAVIAGSAVCLVVSQFLAYRGVEVGRPGYAGLPAAAAPPEVDVRAPVDEHGPLLLPLALAALLLAFFAAGGRGRAPALAIAACGAIALAVVLLIDLPAGLDEGTATVRFSGANATLTDAFYAQLAAAAGMTLGGLLLAKLTGPQPVGNRRTAAKTEPAQDAGSEARGAHFPVRDPSRVD